jgi:hypothetical protein
MENFVYDSGIRSETPPPLISRKQDLIIKAKQLNDDHYWEYMREVFADDFENLDRSRFRVWQSVLSVPLMVRSRFQYYFATALSAAVRDPIYAQALEQRMIGMTLNDFELLFRVVDDFPTTANRIQNLSHLLLGEIYVEKLSQMDSIVELGGGVGDMADIIHTLGFKGRYQLYDFPELGAIQKWHHRQLGIADKIEYISDYTKLEPADLVIATWSLTEMPIDLRTKIEEQLKHSKRWLVAYSNKIFGMDNASYMKQFAEKLTTAGSNVTFIDVPFMPWDGGTRYMFAKPQ